MKDGSWRFSALTVRVVAPVVIALIFAAGLAYFALDATRAQRAAARRTVTDFADFAAFIIAGAARQDIERRLLYAFGGLRAWDPASGTPLPEPATLGRDRTEAQRCAASGLPEPTYARLDLRTGAFTLAGSPIPDATARWLADTLAVEAASAYQEAWSFAHVLSDRPVANALAPDPNTGTPGSNAGTPDPDAGMAVVAYTLVRDGTGTAIAAYAKSSCLAIDGKSVFALAAAATTALPPTLMGGLPNDSLLTVLVRDARGRVVPGMASNATSSNATPSNGLSPGAPQTSSIIGSGATGPLPQLGNLELVVDIRPDVADRLVVGGIPYGGAPMALLLLLLITGFGLLAVVQLRRQHALMRARERFISNVSHELRTPLQQILVFAELLGMEKIESADERRHSISVIERETRRLIQLVENVLAFARSTRGDHALASDSVDLEALVRETVQAFEPLARANGASVEVVVDAPANATTDAPVSPGADAPVSPIAGAPTPAGADAPVPAGAGAHVSVRGDAGAVRRILLNLLDNAVKYGPAGQVVTVRIGGANGNATLTIDDQGPGIAPEHRASVWKPFERLDSERRAPADAPPTHRSTSTGSGIGLAIVRDLVDRMGGDVRVEDAPGGGARFVVSLP